MIEGGCSQNRLRLRAKDCRQSAVLKPKPKCTTVEFRVKDCRQSAVLKPKHKCRSVEFRVKDCRQSAVLNPKPKCRTVEFSVKALPQKRSGTVIVLTGLASRCAQLGKELSSGLK